MYLIGYACNVKYCILKKSKLLESLEKNSSFMYACLQISANDICKVIDAQMDCMLQALIYSKYYIFICITHYLNDRSQPH